MIVKCAAVFLFGIVAFNCHAVAGFNLQQAATINNQELAKWIVNLILENQHTSVDNLHKIFTEANGDVTKIVSGINSEVGQNLIKIDSNLIKLDFDAGRALIRSAVQSYVRKTFSTNPIMGLTLQLSIESQLRIHENEIRNALNKNAIPVQVLGSLAAFSNTAANNRQKRGIIPNPNDILLMLLSQLLGPIDDVVINTLETAKNDLLANYVSAQPSGDIEAVIMLVKNIAIKRAVEVITVLQLNINGTLTGTDPGQGGGGLVGLDIFAIVNDILAIILRP